MRNLVRDYREAKGLTQYQLAKLVGLTRRGILTLEKGEGEPKLGNALKIAQVLDVELDTLFCFKEYLKNEQLPKKFLSNPARYKNGDNSKQM